MTDSLREAGAHGSVVSAAAGAGASDVPRRQLDERQVRAIVVGEVAETREAADQYKRHGRLEEAERLRRQAAMLESHLT